VKGIKTQHRYIEERAQGKSQRAVADELGIGLQTVVRWERKFKEQIESLKALELEALREKFLLTEKARIERLGGQLLRIRDQLDERDFLDVETPKLLDMELKLDAALSKGDARLAHKTPSDQTEAPGVSFAQSPEYKKLRSELMRVLEQFPEVRDEVSLRLLEGEVSLRDAGRDGNGKRHKRQS
jgi:transcriptional regulator with XRE-family HTH domain